jgi:lipopolysaccharide transport system ATP-binding protein
MTDTVVQIETLSKKYQLGAIGYGSFHRDFEAWLARIRGREDPNAPLHARGKKDLHGDFWALRDINLEVTLGDRVGIIGRNGAGKSTLLKILSQITRPTMGTVRIRGRVASLLEVGTGFHPELTGRENVMLNGAIMGMKRDEIQKKFDEIVAFAGVEQFIDTPVKRYSSGMYVRLGFAVAAHLEPEILIVDEVLAVGDAEFQKKCLVKMEDVSKEGRTVIFVSHNMFSIQTFCRRGIVLDHGMVKVDAEIKEAVECYLGAGLTENGETKWDAPDDAPGDGRARLKSVRVVSGGKVSGDVDIDKDFQIEVEHWNLEPNSRRIVSIHLVNGMGLTVLASSNMASVSITPDPWTGKLYPPGLFRTVCTIPGFLLNDGPYSITVYVNEGNATGVILEERDVLAFNVKETGAMRKEYLTGPWLGIIRPRLDWNTTKVE